MDHTIGHCRAQRQALYSRADVYRATQEGPNDAQCIFSFKGNDEAWADCRAQLERWGMEIIELDECEGRQRKADAVNASDR